MDDFEVFLLLILGIVLGVVIGIVGGVCMDTQLGDEWRVTLADGSSVTGKVTTDLTSGIVWVHRKDDQVQPVLESDIVELKAVDDATPAR